MPDTTGPAQPRALLLTGVPGCGKTSVAVEIGSQLEAMQQTYAVIDLDWLAWFDSGEAQPPELVHSMLLRNLASVLGNYTELALHHYVLTRALRTRAELDSVTATIGMPVTSVELVVAHAVLDHRLGSAVTTERADDVQAAREWLADPDRPHADFTVANEGAVAATAAAVIQRLGWA